jgi:hypothetical protein
MTRRTPGPHRRRVARSPKERRVDVRREELNTLVELLHKRGEIVNQILEEQNI